MNLLHRLDPVAFARKRLGFHPDPHQRRVMRRRAKRDLRAWCRQSGKSTTAAAEAVYEAAARPGSLVLVVSPSQRQSGELHLKVREFFDRLHDRAEVVGEESKTTITTSSGSRVVALPDSPDTVRGYSAPSLVILDEASRLSDESYAAVRPMLAHGGRLVVMSTPRGRRGFFAEAWHEGSQWTRSEVRAEDVARIDPAFLAEEREALGEAIYQQEYENRFLDGAEAMFDSEQLAALLDDRVAPLFGPGGEADLGPPPSAEDLASLLNSSGGSA